MKASEKVLTEIAVGRIKCHYHNEFESWKRFSTVCKDAIFDKYFGITSCYWHIIKYFMTEEQAKVLIAFYPFGRDEMDGIVSGSAMALRDKLKDELAWFFTPRNLAKYDSHEEILNDLPKVPSGLYGGNPELRVKLGRLCERVSKTKISRVVPREISVKVHFAAGPGWTKPKDVVMSDFIEYLKIITHKKNITRVWEVLESGTPANREVLVVAGSRSGPSIKIGLSTIGSCVLV